MFSNLSVCRKSWITVKETKWNHVLVGDNLQDLGIVEKIILKYILEKQDGRAWTGYVWNRVGMGCGLL
jgi:hypothetical protein